MLNNRRRGMLKLLNWRTMGLQGVALSCSLISFSRLCVAQWRSDALAHVCAANCQSGSAS